MAYGEIPAMTRSHVLTLVLAVHACAVAAAAFVDLPPGFTRHDAALGLSDPTTLAFAADGRLFVAQQDGIVRVYVNGV